jgi:tricorn protease
MPTAGAGDFSPDGARIVYSPLFRDFRTWKRYSGGWAQDLYLFDLASRDATLIAHSDRAERDPMWIGDAVYFSSDRDGTSTSSATTSDTRRHAADPQHGPPTCAGQLGQPRPHRLRAGRGPPRVRREDDRRHGAAVFVPDDGVNRRPSRVSAEKQIEDFELSPKGERALFVARGDVFTLPIEKGPRAT